MLGKFFGKKEEKFFAALPETAGEAITDAVAAVAPALVEKSDSETVAPETGLDKAGVAVAEGNAMAIAPESTAPVPTGIAFSDPKAIIAAALKANSEEMAAAASKQVEGVFAQDCLLMAGNKSGRRSPGASMASFMDMAKNIKS
ncbi:MAG: hypothetical protein HC799_03110 [Limnothrix sp. RL_2_0]|nr:hypothetical protein [Limnothrix sp. RL_2_0]